MLKRLDILMASEQKHTSVTLELRRKFQSYRVLLSTSERTFILHLGEERL